jgi:hypothetical protein
MAEKKKYFIQQYLNEEYTHGGIGPVHAESILLKNGYHPINFPHHQSFTFFSKLGRLFFLLRVTKAIQRGSIVIFLFPVYARMNKLLIKWLTKKKGITCICFIADIDGIKDADEEKLKIEKQELSAFSHFIVHNSQMKKWVNENVSRDVRIAEIEFFDFLAPAAENRLQLSKNIVFAGNLHKSGFIKNLPVVLSAQPSLRFNLYGPGMFKMDESYGGISYHGVFQPTELISKLNGSFGLVWDGDSVERPSGIFGHYLQFITHHKLSLYILAGLPIIIPSSAGSAPLVSKYGIGLLVDSLFDIESIIDSITEEQYQLMRANMQPLAARISSGGCLENALEGLMADG